MQIHEKTESKKSRVRVSLNRQLYTHFSFCSFHTKTPGEDLKHTLELDRMFNILQTPILRKSSCVFLGTVLYVRMEIHGRQFFPPNYCECLHLLCDTHTQCVLCLRE